MRTLPDEPCPRCHRKGTLEERRSGAWGWKRCSWCYTTFRLHERKPERSPAHYGRCYNAWVGKHAWPDEEAA